MNFFIINQGEESLIYKSFKLKVRKKILESWGFFFKILVLENGNVFAYLLEI